MTKLRLLQPFSVWLTGLPCSGKSTIARCLVEELRQQSIPVLLVDGDEIRPLIAPDLSHSVADRRRSLDRYLSLIRLLNKNRISSVVAVTNHTAEQRRVSRVQLQPCNYLEVWVDTPLEICEGRDVKGMYRRARQGSLTSLVGVDIQYEVPENYEVRIATADESPEEATVRIVDELTKRKLVGHCKP